MRIRHMLLATALLLVACRLDLHVDDDPKQPAPETLKVGLLVTLTGSEAFTGLSIQYGAYLALQEINAQGGVNGRRLELLVRDTKLSADAGMQGARELVAGGAVAIVGADTSRVTVPVAGQVTIPLGLALISPAATSPLISTLVDNDTVWRTVPSDALQGTILADEIVGQGLSQVALIHVDDFYGNGLAAAVASRLQARGANILADVAYPSDKEVSFQSEVSELLANGTPAAVVIVGFALDSASIVQALQQALPGGLPRLFGVDGSFDSGLLFNAGPAVIGMQGTAPTPPRSSPDYQLFQFKFLQAVGELPEQYAESAYDAVYLVALALAQGGSNTAASVPANLRAVSRADTATPVLIRPGDYRLALTAIARGDDIDYQGVAGPLDLDANGEPESGTYLLWEVVPGDDGRPRFVERKVISFP